METQGTTGAGFQIKKTNWWKNSVVLAASVEVNILGQDPASGLRVSRRDSQNRGEGEGVRQELVGNRYY